MGCDGGSIPRREELVKLKKKEEKPNPNEVERIKWTSCSLSKEPLKEPIVTCELGFLYNKEAVIRHLLEKSLDDKFKHIRSLKDLTPVRFTPNPALGEKEKDKTADEASPFVCPITLMEVGHHRFSLLKSCGCVLSERALREIPSTTCLQCGKAYTAADVLPLNPPVEEIEVLKSSMLERRVAEKQDKRENGKKEKKEKKEKKHKKASPDGAETADGVSEKKAKVKARADKKRLLDTTTTTTTSSEPPAKSLKHTDVYSSIFTSSIPKGEKGERVQETFMCRNVLRA